jgi:competence protein ComEA
MKGIKRTSRFLKQYFVFSKTERKGIYALLFLVALSLAIPRLWALAFPPKLLTVNITDLPEQAAADSSFLTDNRMAEAHRLFNFDPNTADSSTLTSLGFVPAAARSMINYRNKGGRFNKAEDLYRIYYADSSFIATLIPYVQITQTPRRLYDKAEAVKQTRPAIVTNIVEVNTADSAALVGLFGIGPKTASRIIEFRNRAGGFVSIEQLTDVYGITEELLFELRGKITVDPAMVRPLHINTVTYEELRQNPYLRYKTASAIINYRKQHGAFTTSEDLKKVIVLHDSVYRKIEPYVVVE